MQPAHFHSIGMTLFKYQLLAFLTVPTSIKIKIKIFCLSGPTSITHFFFLNKAWNLQQLVFYQLLLSEIQNES
jgi:hypothetical protein